jgi:PPOX class probable F420-dependent enzyme
MSNQATIMSKEKLAQFDSQNYISVRTFKKNGQGVDTPVWFAELDGAFYFYTLEDAWKIKRIRNNPKVQVAPCTMRGSVTGDWVDGTAQVLGTESPKIKRADEVITRKYGWQKRIGDFFRMFSKKRRVFISIQLT